MPHLNERTELLRIDQAVQARILMEADARLSKAEACERVGISLYQYNTWIAQASDILEMFRKAQAGLHRVQLDRILTAEEHILEQVLKDGLSPLTDPEARLKILEYLDSRSERLMELVHVGSDADTSFLQGPTLTKVESRFSPSEVTITIKQRPNDIIDITPEREVQPD